MVKSCRSCRSRGCTVQSSSFFWSSSVAIQQCTQQYHRIVRAAESDHNARRGESTNAEVGDSRRKVSEIAMVDAFNEGDATTSAGPRQSGRDRRDRGFAACWGNRAGQPIGSYDSRIESHVSRVYCYTAVFFWRRNSERLLFDLRDSVSARSLSAASR